MGKIWITCRFPRDCNRALLPYGSPGASTKINRAPLKSAKILARNSNFLFKNLFIFLIEMILEKLETDEKLTKTPAKLV